MTIRRTTKTKTLSSVPTDPLERFFYWIKERYQIYHLRRQGLPKPWTKDPILQTVFFTNPYRELDKTTAWFRENVREPLRDLQEVLFATIAFRLFNYIPTGQVLNDPNILLGGKGQAPSLFQCWDRNKALKVLWNQQGQHGKVFTGAYIIKLYNGMTKIAAACDILTEVWDDRENLYTDLMVEAGNDRISWHDGPPGTMQRATNRIMRYPQMGPFMSYEVVCDLRYTHVLENAPDKMTWANLGPGANRGLHRLFTKDVSFARGETPKFPNALERMKELLRLSSEYLPSKEWEVMADTGNPPLNKRIYKIKIPKMPKLEMREIEHSLCEFDKYERARLADGSLKRMFAGR